MIVLNISHLKKGFWAAFTYQTNGNTREKQELIPSGKK